MELGDFLLFVTTTIGLTHIMVDSVIMQPLRNWIKTKAEKEYIKQNALDIEIKTSWFWGKVAQVLSCYQCSGFWCGLVAGAVTVSYNPLVMLACGFASSFLSLFAAHLLNYLEAKSIIELPKNGN